jgi:hypothetical protein
MAKATGVEPEDARRNDKRSEMSRAKKENIINDAIPMGQGG